MKIEETCLCCKHHQEEEGTTWCDVHGYKDYDPHMTCEDFEDV